VIDHLYNNGPAPGKPPRVATARPLPAAVEHVAVRAAHAPQEHLAVGATSFATGKTHASLTPPHIELYLLVASAGPRRVVDTTNWTARIRCNQFEVKSSFIVFIFIGKESDIPGDAKQWSKSPNLAGCNDIFVNSKPEHCSNCTDNADLATEGYVQLNDALMGSVGSVQKDIVTPYLKEHLHWRVAKVSPTHIGLTNYQWY
jgi:tyrosinase